MLQRDKAWILRCIRIKLVFQYACDCGEGALGT